MAAVLTPMPLRNPRLETPGPPGDSVHDDMLPFFRLSRRRRVATEHHPPTERRRAGLQAEVRNGFRSGGPGAQENFGDKFGRRLFKVFRRTGRGPGLPVTLQRTGALSSRSALTRRWIAPGRSSTLLPFRFVVASRSALHPSSAA